MFGIHIPAYCIASKYSNALQNSQTCSFAKWYHTLHPKVAFEAPWSCACRGIKSCLDVILHPSLNQGWKTLLFEYLAAIRYIYLIYYIYTPCMYTLPYIFSNDKGSLADNCGHDYDPGLPVDRIQFYTNSRRCWHRRPRSYRSYRSVGRRTISTRCTDCSARSPVILYQPKYQLGRPENYSFSQSIRKINDERIQKTFHFISKTEALEITSVLFRPMYRFGHPEEYLSLLSTVTLTETSHRAKPLEITL